MKRSFAKIYAVYLLGLITSRFTPMWLMKLTGDKITKPFTMAFSNTPGVLRRINYKDSVTLGSFSSFICGGRVAISIAIISYAENIKFSVTADTSVSVDPKELRDKLQQSIDEMLALARQKEQSTES